MKRSQAMPAPLQRRAARSPMRCALAWLLMLAVLFGQSLGAVHVISHGAPGAGGHAHALAAAAHGQGAACEHEHDEPHAHSQGFGHGHAQGLQALFGHAPDEPGCRLYDQLLQAGPLMPSPTVVAVPVRACALPPPDIGVRLAASAAVYLARGPPRA